MTKLQLESDALQSAINIASKVGVAADGSVTFAGSQGKLLMHSTSELRRCSLVIPAEISGKDFEFAIPLDAIRDATKGHDKLNMSWDGTMLNVKSGTYTSELLTLDAIGRDSIDKVEAREWKVTPEQAVWLKGALSSVALRPTTLISSFIPVSVKLTDKGAFVACYDMQHMAFLHSKEITGDLELTVPLDALQMILDILDKQAFKMSVSSSRVELKSKTAAILLNLPAMDDSISLDAVMGKAREVQKAKGTTLKLTKDEMLRYLENARSVIGKERAELNIQAKDGKAKFTIKTVRGTSSVVIKSTVSKGLNINIDYEYFSEVLGKIREPEFEITVVGDAFMCAQAGPTHLLVALNQEAK